jgi:hypothetical protein
MIARVETGAMHAEWRGREETADGEIATIAGYDEFWIENGLIRRQRGVLHPLSFQAEDESTPRAPRGSIPANPSSASAPSSCRTIRWCS